MLLSLEFGGLGEKEPEANKRAKQVGVTIA
jgi:hypothetical protein